MFKLFIPIIRFWFVLLVSLVYLLLLFLARFSSVSVFALFCLVL